MWSCCCRCDVAVVMLLLWCCCCCSIVPNWNIHPTFEWTPKSNRRTNPAKFGHSGEGGRSNLVRHWRWQRGQTCSIQSSLNFLFCSFSLFFKSSASTRRWCCCWRWWCCCCCWWCCCCCLSFLQLSVLISSIYFPLSSMNQAACQLIIQFISIFLIDVLCHLFWLEWRHPSETKAQVFGSVTILWLNRGITRHTGHVEDCWMKWQRVLIQGSYSTIRKNILHCPSVRFI